MLGSVLILGGVAAANMAAGHAEAEMNPSVTHFQALFATAGMRFHAVDLVGVGALRHVLIVGADRSIECYDRR